MNSAPTPTRREHLFLFRRRSTTLILSGFLFLLTTTLNASADLISTYAGGPPFSTTSNITNGIPATNALLNGVKGLATDLIGNLYLAHDSGSAVRRVNATNGLLDTLAGNGTFGTSGDGGPAVAAGLSTPQSVAVDLTGNIYVCDNLDSRVRKIDVATGLIQTVVGTDVIGYDVDDIPATNASLSFPLGIAVDVHGNLYIADTSAGLVRKVDAATGFIHRLAGQYLLHGHTGDGGPSVNARINSPLRIAVDASDNVYFIDQGDRVYIRRIDGVTGIITTIAGGGDGDGSSGLATNVSLDINANGFTATAQDLAVDNLGSLYIAGWSQLWKVDLATGNISIIAGAGGTTVGFSGDGGPATNALFNQALGLALSGAGDIYFTDSGNDRVRRITPDPGPPFQVLVDLTVSQSCLPVQTQVRSNLYLATVNGRLSLVLPNGTNVPGDVIVTNSTSLSAITVPAPAKVGGNLSINAGTNSTSWDLSQLTDVNGSLTFAGDGPANLTAGNMQVNGDLTVGTGNGTIVDIHAPSVSGDLTIGTGNGSIVDIGVASVTNDVVLTTGNGSTIGVDAATVGSNLTATTGSDSTVDIGSVTVAGNLTATTGNGTTVHIGTATVAGDLTASTGGTTNVDFSGAQVSGNTTLVTGDATTVSAATADGNTSVTLSNGPALMQAVLPTGTFTSNVVFTVESVATGSLTNVGTGTNATNLGVSPVAAYRFAFAVPTLNQDASLTFDITLAALAPAAQSDFLAALAAGLATVAVLGDAPSSVWQTFPVCDAGQSPVADGCVSLVKLDATGTPLPSGSTNAPAVVRFVGVAGHFSTWGVVLVQPAAPPVHLATSLLGNGTLRLSWTGPATGVLETSTNLAPNSWSPAGPPTQQPDGSWRLDVAPTEPMRFYRFRSP